MLAGADIAIGAAWRGLFGNFAVGAFMLVLRPFKGGDFVSIAGLQAQYRSGAVRHRHRDPRQCADDRRKRQDSIPTRRSCGLVVIRVGRPPMPHQVHLVKALV
jgi:small-conductance mechanosensitive channel